MRRIHLFLLGVGLSTLATGQSGPVEELREWAPGHVQPLSGVEGETGNDTELDAVRTILGDSHVLAFGEPFHGGHEPLAMRNRLVRYAVTRLGFTGIALETGLTSSKTLYDHVSGKTTETEASLKRAFSYDFGDLPENLELVAWLRAWNSGKPPERQVRLYGVDLEGHMFPDAYRSVEAVLNFLDHAAPDLGKEARSLYGKVIPVFRTDRYVKLAPAGKDSISGKIEDLVTLIRRERVRLTGASSMDDYDWLLRQANMAAQDDAYLRALPSSSEWAVFTKSPERLQASPAWDRRWELRELAMADNLLWVRQRETQRGKVLFFAQDMHVQTAKAVMKSPRERFPFPAQNLTSAGTYLRSALAGDFVSICTFYGHGTSIWKDETPPADAPDTIGGLISALGIPQLLVSLREIPHSGPLREWLQTPQYVAGGRQEPRMAAPLGAPATRSSSWTPLLRRAEILYRFRGDERSAWVFQVMRKLSGTL